MMFNIREIQPRDNQRMAAIIRQVLTEYGANRPGFAWADPELDDLSDAYQAAGAVYYVVTCDSDVIGGAGIAPFPCEYPQLCELQKMYLLPDYRGQGLGQTLMTKLIHWARSAPYRGCYLETFGPMTAALALYQKFGFQPLAQPLGDSGHTSCDRFYLLQFDSPEGTRL
jgi:putative acetyltransferase